MNFKKIFVASLLLIVNKANAQIDSSYIYRKPLFDFDYLKPVFKLNEEQSTNKNRFLRFVIYTGYREGVERIQGMANFAGVTDTLTNTRRIFMYNLSIVDMVTHGFVSPDHIILEVKNPAKYRFYSRFGSKEEWMRKNGHCFELLLPIGLTPLSELENQLSQTLGLEFGYENRKIKTLILFRTSTNDKMKSSGLGKGKYNQSGLFHNLPLSKLGEPIYDAGLPLLIDETGYTSAVDLDLKINSWADVSSVRQELKHYDLDIKEEMREVKMFVIKEIN